MSLIFDALRPSLTHGILAIRGRATTTLDTLIASQVGFYPSFDSLSKIWELDFRVTEPVAGVMAAECARLGCAAFQTYHDASGALSTRNDVPWALIRVYYASYYAAHTLLRTLNTACSYIDGPRLSIMRRVLNTYGITDQFEKGLYDVSVVNGGSTMRFRLAGAGTGGTHEQFWAIFARRVRTLEAEVLTSGLPSGDAQRVFVSLQALRAVLARGSSADSWLSGIRNEVQYRQGRGVWYPPRISDRECEALGRIANQWMGDPLAIDLNTRQHGELGLFVAACAYVVGLCRGFIKHIADRTRGGRSFVLYGPLAYLSQKCI